MGQYQRQGQSFPTVTKGGLEYPVTLIGAQVRDYLGVASVSASGSAQLLSTAVTIPPNTEFADIYCEGSTAADLVRFWHGATAPTTSIGVRLKDHEVIQSASPANFRFILGAGSGPCTLRIEFYRYL